MTELNTQTISELQQQANVGDPRVQLELAYYYEKQVNEFNSDNIAFEWLEKAANQGCVEAQLTIGLYYLLDSDKKLLWKRWNDQMESGEKNTPLCLAGGLVVLKLFEVNNDRLAIDWLKKAADQNNPDAQFWLAYCYYNGIGAVQDFELAFSLFNQAAIQNVPDAMTYIAVCYLKGQGVEQNDKAAFEWLNKSVELGCDIGFLIMGRLHSLGRCVSQNPKMAFNWFQKAAYLNNAEAQYLLALEYAKGRVVERDYDKELYWKVRAADNGHKEAKKHMIRYYLQKAADYGSANAHLAVGEFYKKGEGVDKDENLARDYSDRALYLFEKENDFTDDESNPLKTVAHLDIASLGVNSVAAHHIKQAKISFLKSSQKLDETEKALILETKQKENSNHRMQKLVEQFTHTLGNVIFPDTIYQVAERLKNNPECRKDVLLLHEAYHSEIIIKLQGELLRQRYTNTNPEKFRQFIRSCRRTPNSAENTKSIEDILDYAASRVTARFLNQHYAGLNSIRDKMLTKKNHSLDALKQKFEDDILLNKTLRPITWINQYLRPVQITEISPLWQKVFMLSESHAEALLFGYFSEILFNAFKYADHDKDEFLTLVFGEKIINDKTYLTCSWLNPVKDKSPAMLGTGKGLDAIQEDLKQLNDTESPEESLLISQQNKQFQVTLFFTKDLLVNDLPSLKIKRKANVE